MNKILVIGSLNADLFTQVEQLPRPGETIRCHSFEVMPGGKGMNQAVVASKLGATVTMAGCVGDDAYGTMLLDTLVKQGIDCSHIQIRQGTSTGMAIVTTSPLDNSIVVIPGANATVDCAYVDSILDEIKKTDLVVLQLEIPMETVYYVIDRCEEYNVPVLLNPAPAGQLDPDYIDKVDYLIPNETELESMFHDNYEHVLEQYPNKIIMSAGKRGAYYHDGTQLVHCKARTVSVVDTTGAGDAFNGAVAYALLGQRSLRECVEFANGIAAITTTVKGAQGASADRYTQNI